MINFLIKKENNAFQIEPKFIDYDPKSPVKLRHSYFKLNGWGFKDTKFVLENKVVSITGERYSFSGKKMSKYFPFAENECKISMSKPIAVPQTKMIVDSLIINEPFIKEIGNSFSRCSFTDEERQIHSHGHTLEEVFALKYGKFKRFVDCVIYPSKTEHVIDIVKAATKNNVVIIPYGGGTSVTQALAVPENEKRMVVSVDMARMNHIKWVDKENNLVCAEAGIVGIDLENELEKQGVCTGHEPDSIEFSTLGGWIATRCSGMKKNCYGNIEDMLVNVKIVTPQGIFEKKNNWPRVSNGPDPIQIILGSEGILGIITEAIVRIRPVPETKEYNSILFPNFLEGSKFMKEVSLSMINPASCRLIDNLQFRFGYTLNPDDDSIKKKVISFMKNMYVTKIKGFNPYEMSVAILVFEGPKSIVNSQKKRIFEIASKYGGLEAGAENGIRGYFLTFMIAYIRDFMMEHHFIAESFETSVPWSKVYELCEKAKAAILNKCKMLGVQGKPFCTFRITLTYETGATVYCYFGFTYEGLSDPVAAYSEIEEEARKVVMECGGSLSHHHGIGKLRKKFMPLVYEPVGMNMIKAIKNQIDPQNIFGNENLIN